jgi:hypothetical protein
VPAADIRANPPRVVVKYQAQCPISRSSAGKSISRIDAASSIAVSFSACGATAVLGFEMNGFAGSLTRLESRSAAQLTARVDGLVSTRL